MLENPGSNTGVAKNIVTVICDWDWTHGPLITWQALYLVTKSEDQKSSAGRQNMVEITSCICMVTRIEFYYLEQVIFAIFRLNCNDVCDG